MTARIAPPPYSANDGDPLTAIRCAARWCVAAEHTNEDVCEVPSIAPVRVAIVAALANTSRATMDGLAAALTRWCERTSCEGYDHTALAPRVLAAVDVAGACTTATVGLQTP